MSSKKCKDNVKHCVKRSIDLMESSCSLYDVMIEKDEGGLINFRIAKELREDFKIAAKLLGFKGMSGALYHYIVRTVSEQKTKHPDAFSTKSVAGDNRNSENDIASNHLMSNGTSQPLTGEQEEMARRDISKAKRKARELGRKKGGAKKRR
jgi:hypothetical protein